MTRTPLQREKAKHTRFWKRTNRQSSWHVFLGRSTFSECLGLERTTESIEAQYGPGAPRRVHNERHSLPPIKHRICSRCMDSIGLQRRSKRSAGARITEIRADLEQAARIALAELDQIMLVAPELVSAVRQGIEALACRRPWSGSERCMDTGVRCPNCLARDRLSRAVRLYTTRTAEVGRSGDGEHEADDDDGEHE